MPFRIKGTDAKGDSYWLTYKATWDSRASMAADFRGGEAVTARTELLRRNQRLDADERMEIEIVERKF